VWPWEAEQRESNGIRFPNHLRIRQEGPAGEQELLLVWLHPVPSVAGGATSCPGIHIPSGLLKQGPCFEPLRA
jgi:hypothetical protein